MGEINRDTLVDAGASAKQADAIAKALSKHAKRHPQEAWALLTEDLLTPDIPFAVHRAVYDQVYANWDLNDGPPPAWQPSPDRVARSNVVRFCKRLAVRDPANLHAVSIGDRVQFWKAVIDELGIVFRTPPDAILADPVDIESPQWLPGARLNIAESCFRAPVHANAVVYQREGEPVKSVTYGELENLCNRFARSLHGAGIQRGDAVAIAMPMTLEAVCAYVGVVKMGGVVVSVADSFAADEIATRLRIGDAKAVVTQDVIVRAGKTLPMYEKVIAADAPKAIVVPNAATPVVELREGDYLWDDFLLDAESFALVACEPDDPMNVLFSSGTTGDPKAIPWDHTTPIKCAMDGFLHHDIHAGDVVAWPTNLGWMMGPWLIYAALINKATIALYYGPPNTPGFCRFVEEARVNMLGVVPSLVKAWRNGDMIAGCDWTGIDTFSSTGEASNTDDMLYLMAAAGYRPIIEYCGGTEIGGGYITGTVIRPAAPATFSSPAFGLSFHILDDNGRPCDNGELFLGPPSIGLSRRLLNRDHHEVYYANTPKGPDGELLRRHGDQMAALPNGYYRAHGRADDTMNLGGIKTSSAELERVLAGIDGVLETAAIAVEPRDGGPSRLVIYAVPEPGATLNADGLKGEMQRAISAHLNPLFRVHDVVVIESLPRTASNKVMRRLLRDDHPASQ